MKIVMVAIPSLHFFSWTDQLKNAGHEVYWFDISGTSQKVKKIEWVCQKLNWKLKQNYPGRTFVKKHFSKTYNFFQKYNQYDTAKMFEAYLLEIQPDVVHSFALQLSCLPIIQVMNKFQNLKWIFSSWGSDVFYAKEIGIAEYQLAACLKRIDYLITDCERDYKIAVDKGFKNKFLGVFPGNGGVAFDTKLFHSNSSSRNIILIKGYNDDIGRGINIIKALDDKVIELLKLYEVIIFGADDAIKKYIAENSRFKNLKYKLYLRSESVANQDLIALMGKSYLYVGNSLSDGIPNALIEAMGMGAFPIQSNPGRVTEEIINSGSNGLLISDPDDISEITTLIAQALKNKELVTNAFIFNTTVVKSKYERGKVKAQIIKMYEKITY